jgi:hypothetical protein
LGNKNGPQKKKLGKESLCYVVPNFFFGGLEAPSVVLWRPKKINVLTTFDQQNLKLNFVLSFKT